MYRQLSNNHFNGAFSTGPYLNPSDLYLSNNNFTNIKFANFTGPTESRMGLETVYMPNLRFLEINNNKLGGPFPMEILQMPSLFHLDLSQNKFYGSINFSGTPWLSSLYTFSTFQGNE
jgi:hypothetical protein